MKTKSPIQTRAPRIAAGLFLPLVLLVPVVGRAQAPGIITYQGRITNNGASFTGGGQFRLLINRDGLPPASLWSHANSSIRNSEIGPAASQ